MSTGQIGLGYYAVIPEPATVTEDDRLRTMRVFEKVFAQYGSPQPTTTTTVPSTPRERSTRDAK